MSSFLQNYFVSFIAGLLNHQPLAWILYGIISGAVILGVLSAYGALAVYAERKIMAFMQCRLGPMEVGPEIELRIAGMKILPKGWYGLGVLIADGIKLLGKEDTVPAKADSLIFKLAPAIVFAATITSFVVIPFAPFFTPADIDAGILVILAASSIVAVGIVMGGYASNNKWSLYGAIRSVAQVVSYEVPMGLALLSVVMTTGSLALADIADNQSGWAWNWHAFSNVWLFIAAIIYIISSLAETNRTPFDIPEAEAELVAGYHTEYSGMRFALFMFAEYINMLLVSLIASVFFFGGYYSGIQWLDRYYFLGPFVLGAKALLLVIIMIWLRWTLPRFRVDQLMTLCWKAMLPLSIIAFVGAAAALFQTSLVFAIFWRFCILILLALFAFEVAKGIRTKSISRKATE
ncbi:MAG: NADH-quinone oxidoreductase subunit NuoH [Candidatus Hydrogenedentes bacterium CG07_land_8_20_14_0_80_42_17]|nr:MAG: hypothetical protein AUJ18_00425 [Candidatus Hydrogenedentes bacterium CG1_02_42_14]PIU47917.1 MAG: NADH-quinone oxidoreductase subunit NuoH [Candidatus Hydrogenedentes bacterium CG07_land_8_20_14_0_80_42_17]